MLKMNSVVPPAKVLITGGEGKLSRALAGAAPKHFTLVLLSRRGLDITDPIAIAQALTAHAPDIVLNGAAYNLVDRAESEPNAALRVNSAGPAILARECAARGITLVHFSTDLVFDGRRRSPYLETDAARPLSVYGASKLVGEKAVLAEGPGHFVIRVCRLFGPVEPGRETAGANFPLLMLKLARERGKVTVVNDQVGSPTYTLDLARAVWQLLENASGGMFHLCNDGEVSFHEYAATIFEMADVDCEVEAVSSLSFGAPAHRPSYSVMSSEKAVSAGVSPLRDWRQALQEFLLAQV